MQDVFELFAEGRISKDMAGELVAAHAAIGADKVLAEELSDFGQSGLARLNDLASQQVRIHNRNSAVAQQLVGGGFAHADAAGEAEDFHSLKCRVGDLKSEAKREAIAVNAGRAAGH